MKKNENAYFSHDLFHSGLSVVERRCPDSQNEINFLHHKIDAESTLPMNPRIASVGNARTVASSNEAN